MRLGVFGGPCKQTPEDALAPEQRVASNPEVHLHLDRLLTRLPVTGPTRVLVAVIQLLWMSALRFQHMQRSMPVKLTAHLLYRVCWKGKGKPGYRCACPRYGPANADVGGCVWEKLQSVAKGSPQPPLGLLYGNGAAFSLANIHTASRAVLEKHFGMHDTDIFSSNSLQRSMPTLADMSGTHPGDEDAVGDCDWMLAKDTKMHVRYADPHEERSAVVKLTHMLLARQMARAQSQIALSWDACRHLLCKLDKAAVSSQANQMMASDVVQEEIPERLLG